MITPSQLFFTRLKHNGKKQLRAWNSVFDWTVWIYLLIPGAIIFGGLYGEVWLEMPEWAMNVPWAAIYPFALFIVMVFGRVRVFVEEADRLFLLQRPDWFKGLKRRGMVYSFAKQAILLLLPIALLLPFLLKAEGLSWMQLAHAYLYSFLYGMMMSLIIHELTGRFRGWRKWVVETLVLLVLAAIYLLPMLSLLPGSNVFAMVGIVILAVFIFLLVHNWHTGIRYEAEVKQEQEAQLRSTELLMSQVIESKPRVRLKRPFLFRKSQRLFKKSDASTMLAEMRIKFFLRALTHIRLWIGFISVSAYAITLVPPFAGFAVLVVLAMLGSSWLHMQWEQWYAEEFITQFPWTKEDAKRAISISRFWLLLPALSIWSLVAVLKIIV